MKEEFIQSILNAQACDADRPFVQANARAITESTPPLTQKETEGDLPYPYPGKNPSGEM